MESTCIATDRARSFAYVVLVWVVVLVVVVLVVISLCWFRCSSVDFVYV